MPKIKPSLSQHLRNLINEFGNDVFHTNGTVLFYQICDKVETEKKFRVQQHVSCMKHQLSMERLNAKKQSLINFTSISNGGMCTFSLDLCEALMSANIPLGKLSNIKFRKFLAKYTNKCIPDESTLRKTYQNLLRKYH